MPSAVERSHDLRLRPQRPGELTSTLVVSLADGARWHAAAEAANAGIPVALWLSISIEGHRCLDAFSCDDADRAGLAGQLDAAAAHDAALPAAASSSALEQLRAYANALVTPRPRPAARELAPASLPLSPALHVAAAWTIESSREGMGVSEWASSVAASQPPGRLAWEAASAARGMTLAEWAAAQATRRARSSSASAQSDACG